MSEQFFALSVKMAMQLHGPLPTGMLINRWNGYSSKKFDTGLKLALILVLNY